MTTPAAKPAPRWSVKPVTASTWADFDTLFKAKGSPSYCWCMAWRATTEEKKKPGNAARKRAMKSRVDGKVPIGLIGYLGGEPVAWCSVAPSTTFIGLRRDVEPGDDVWSVTCFFVRREHRGEGLTQKMLKAAIAYAKKRGATTVEGYAVKEDSPSYRHMGFIPLFEDAGFREVAKAGSRRHVMRRRATA